MKISNPYENISSKVRHKNISHEHTWTWSDVSPIDNSRLKLCLDRGIDILTGVCYSPSIPSVPATGFSYDYEDWEFILDNDGNIVYEEDSEGNRKTMTVGSDTIYIPKLRRITRTYSNYFEDFVLSDGSMTDLANMVELPDSEHAFFIMPDGSVNGGIHLNFIGSIWGDAVNGKLPGLDKFNSDNNISWSSGAFRSTFVLWTLE